jgi:hypothetical protein
MEKRGQGLSTEAIVIMAIAILILVVLSIMLFSRYKSGTSAISYVSNPLEYKAACLAKYSQDSEAYGACVSRCETAAKSKQKLDECSLKSEKT